MAQALPQTQPVRKKHSDLTCGKVASLVRLLKTESLWAGKSFQSSELPRDALTSWSEAGALNPDGISQDSTGPTQDCGGWTLVDASQHSGMNLPDLNCPPRNVFIQKTGSRSGLTTSRINPMDS
jgi:hypothetical protein